jgi:arylsulfatase
VIDIAPTILEATGVREPTMINGVQQKPMEGISLMYSFDDAKAPTRHRTQYFELVGNRGVYEDGWIACTTPLRLPWMTSATDANPDDFKWELYHVAEDFSEAKNLAAENPEKLKELREVFDREAKKYNVYPFDSSFAQRFAANLRPSITRGRSTFTYFPGTIRIPEGSAPETKNRDFTIMADVEIPESGAEGVLATIGGRFGGWGLLVMDGKAEFDYAFGNQKKDKTRIVSKEKLAPGKHTIKLEFKYNGPGLGKGGVGTLLVDGLEVAQGKIDRTTPFRFSLDETFDIGQDTGTPVIEEYEAKMPFKFTGVLKKVVIELGKSGLAMKDEKAIQEGFKRIAAVRD